MTDRAVNVAVEDDDAQAPVSVAALSVTEEGAPETFVRSRLRRMRRPM